ncbi:flagellar hook-basal body complex protein FliE [Sphingorhabdus sp. Alg239-R122]|uniref:flagellar hook-basal body complex protein FliE n=1 Tax=Sphingorhabdus sp. Alg239-R122 TaxID=2305989 RepID=UPI0013DA91F9|nr:flagellar hook-basal body complex protein FliE [Sphingorhabdus sp. Alg239-R122]
MTIDPIAAVGLADIQQPILSQMNAPSEIANVAVTAQDKATQATEFSDILMSRIAEVENKVTHANDMVRSFAIDDSVPLHQVTFALEEARLSFELMLQVRTRLVEGYREIMNMQM